MFLANSSSGDSRRQQIILAEVTAIPDRPNRMDHVLCRKPIAFGDLGVAGRAAMQHAALGEQFRAGGAMDRAIDAAPAKERRVGRVDDGVNAQCGDVGNDDFKPRLADQARRQGFRPQR